MGRLHQLGLGLLLFWCFATSLSNVLAQDVCSLTVRVLSPDGRRPEVPISVQEANGRVVEKDQLPAGGDVRFCDLGILPVTVTVGSDGLCNQVTIRRVPVSLERAYLLKVTYDPEACDIWHGAPPPVPLCELLFRVADTDGKWLSGVVLKLSSPKELELKTDRYGRAHVFLRRDAKVEGSARAKGFRSADFGFICTDEWQEHPIKPEKY